MRAWVIALTFVLVGIVVGTLIGINELSAQERALQSRLATVTKTDRSLHQQVVSLTNQVGVLNVPTDPLSAYDQVCSLSVSTTYTYPSTATAGGLVYMPCASNAETIPQP